MDDVTEWIAQAARCRRLAMVTTDQQTQDALKAFAEELDAKVAEVRDDRREFPERSRKPSRPRD